MPLILVREEKELEEYFSTQLKRCGVDYFDYYLVHDMGGNRRKLAEDTHVFDFLARKKEAGFVQIQLNYLDWKNDTIQSEKCYETAKRHGKSVIVMEPVKGGTLADIPEEAEKLLKSYYPI